MSVINNQTPSVIFQEIGQHHSYQEVWDWQKHLQQKLIVDKRKEIKGRPNYLLLCEHAPVYTLGKSGSMDHLKLNNDELERGNMEFFKINRGGDITFHGPGQITGYPIFNLDYFYHDLHRFVRDIEEVVIRTLADFDIVGGRISEFTGVWIDIDSPAKRKICAIGVHMSRWVSMHGFALNVSTDLSYFDNIIPCGIIDEDKSVTSISQELGTNITPAVVKPLLKAHFADVFGFNYI
jgi:lipoyl(octanoyl) transferase